MRDGTGDNIQAFHAGDGAEVQTVYQGDGTVLWEAIDAPDSDNLQSMYDASQLGLTDGASVDTFPDSVGQRDLVGDASFVTDGINNEPVVHTDGVDDELSAGSGISLTEYTIAGVVELQDTEDGGIIADRDDSSNGWSFQVDGDDWRVTHGGVTAEDSTIGAVTDAVIYVLRYNGTTITLEINGNEVINSDAGYEDGSDIGIGRSRPGAGRFGNLYHAEHLYYDVYQDDPTVDDIKSYLDDKWGPIL